MDTVAISVDLPEETLRELDALAERNRQSRSDCVRQAIERLLQQARLTALPVEDEVLSKEEEASIAEGQAEICRGEVVAWQEAKRRLLAQNR